MTDHAAYPGPNLGPEHGPIAERSAPPIFGFWVFLMSDLVLFGLLIATYLTTLNAHSMAGGPSAGDLADLRSVAAQTVLLLGSSYAHARASLSLRAKDSLGWVAGWMALAMLLAGGFLFLEGRDLLAMVDRGAGPQRSGHLTAYVTLILAHGLHVTVGLLWMTAWLAQAWAHGAADTLKTRHLQIGLYWHMLDVVWIGIVSLVILPGVVLAGTGG